MPRRIKLFYRPITGAILCISRHKSYTLNTFMDVHPPSFKITYALFIIIATRTNTSISSRAITDRQANMISKKEILIG